METAGNDAHRDTLKKILIEKAFVRGSDTPYVIRSHSRLSTDGWLFDIRNILLEPDAIEHILKLFWEEFSHHPIQIGSIETAGIALVAALTTAGILQGKTVSGFYIRKSRKKDGLTKMIEGNVKDLPIVLVDDLMNSGSSLMRQVEVVESLGKKVEAIWVLIRYRDQAYYELFTQRGIRIVSLFELNDFTELGIRNFGPHTPPPPRQSFEVTWKFSAGKPSLFFVVPKSDPAIDSERIYVGSDDGIMWAISQDDGSVVWSYKIGIHSGGKGIFSSPALFNDTVYFGGYDGNFYALDAQTGKKKWMYMEADWIGSSPAIAKDLGLIFVGLEFGLWRKRGGIVALDAASGKKVWWHADMPCYTHSSPLYIAKHQQVVIGSNDGAVRLYNAKDGTLVWTFKETEPTTAEINSGFSARDIKESFAYDDKRDTIIVGNIHGELFSIDRANGTKRATFKAEFGFYSTPVIYKNTVLAASVDKHLYCLDLETLEEKWRWNAGARIFATPVVIQNKIYLGSNSGRLTEIDAETGKETASVTLTERITNRVAYNPNTEQFFVPTFANEVYKATRKLTE